MQNGSYGLFGVEADSTDCAFCRHNDIASYVLKETSKFLIVTDHAPLVEGHLLIIPKCHYACYGAVPADLDAELLALKQEVRQFLAQYYAPVVFWEHGIFRQTVFHAHLHCFPFGALEYDYSQELHGAVVHTQEDIRTWYATQGQYFYMEEHGGTAFLFAPEMDRYLHIIKGIFAQAASRNGYTGWRSPELRQIAGVPLIAATRERWRAYEQRLLDEISIDST
jgi:diadenosine tetraphosphate (Ap4A) HIT family hydrolase